MITYSRVLTSSPQIKCPICGQEFYDYCGFGHCIKHDWPEKKSEPTERKKYLFIARGRKCEMCGIGIVSNAHFCYDCNKERHRAFSARTAQKKRLEKNKQKKAKMQGGV